MNHCDARYYALRFRVLSGRAVAVFVGGPENVDPPPGVTSPAPRSLGMTSAGVVILDGCATALFQTTTRGLIEDLTAEYTSYEAVPFAPGTAAAPAIPSPTAPPILSGPTLTAPPTVRAQLTATTIPVPPTLTAIAHDLRGYLAIFSDGAMFVEWTENNGNLSGTIQSASNKSGAQPDVSTKTAGFTGLRSGSRITLTIPAGFGFATTISGTVEGSTLTLFMPNQQSVTTPYAFHAASMTDYNRAAAALKAAHLNQVQSPITEAATAKTITGDKRPNQRATEFAVGTAMYITYTASTVRRGDWVTLKVYRYTAFEKSVELTSTTTTFDKNATFYGYYSFIPDTAGIYFAELYYNGEVIPSRTLDFTAK